MRARMPFFLFTALAVAALAAAASARPHFGSHGGDRHERFLEHMADLLELDDETRGAIEERFEASREQARVLREERHDARRELRERMREPEPDRDALFAQADRIGALDTELRQLRLATMLDVRDLLTPEQREEMAALREERRRDELEPLMEACAADVDDLCPDVEDPRSLFGCMRENREALSEGCRDAVAELRRGHRRFGGHGCDESAEG